MEEEKRQFKNRQLTPSENKKIIEMYKDLKFVKDISDEVGCADSTVISVITKNGVKLRRSPKKYSSKKKQSAVNECLKLGSIKTASKKLQIPETTLRTWVKKDGRAIEKKDLPPEKKYRGFGW